MNNQKNNSSATAADDQLFEREAMFVYDIHSLFIIDANRCAIDRYGFSKSELFKKKITDLGNRVHLSDLDVKIPEETEIHPKELWQHQNKEGESWLVQLTTQKFRYEGKPVKMAIAHIIDHLLGNDEIDFKRLPRIELGRTHIPFGLLEWNSSLEVLNFSEKAELIFDTSYEEVVGKPAENLSFLENGFVDEFREKMNEIADRGDTYFTFESKYKDSDGSELLCLWHNSLMVDNDRRILKIYSLVVDITQQRKTTSDLVKSETKFRVMSEQSFVGIYILEGRSFSYVNPRLCDITGYSEQELIQTISIWDLVHPDDLKNVRKQYETWEKNPDEPVEFSLRILSKSNQVLHIKTYGSAIEKDGEQALLGVLIDQTGQHKALESYQSLFNCITDGIYIQDEDGNILEVNKGFEEMYGYEKDEIVGKPLSFIAADEKVDMDDTIIRFEKALKGESQTFRWWGKRKDGEVFPKEVKLSQGHFFGQDVVINVAREITENVKREEELKRNEQLFEQLFRNSPLGIALLDKDSNILQVNKSFESMFGYHQEDIEGVDLDELIVPKEDIETARSLYDSKETFTLTKQRKTRSGELIDVFIYGVPVVIEGETIALYGIYTDITGRIQIENKVKQSLHEKEVLLAEIHHRVKNNLAVITGLLELQYHNLQSEEAKNALRDSQMRIRSMALIHEKLYQNESLSDIDLGVYIEELVNVIVKSHASEEKKVNVEIEPVPVKLPIAKAIPCGLVINEIVTNSMKYAFPDDHKNPTIRIELTKTNGRAAIKISDNGIGLPVPFNEIGKGSLGTLLIKTLTSQLEAELDVNAHDGTTYLFSFDLDK